MFKKLAIMLFVLSFAPVSFCADDVQESILNTEATVNQEIMPDTAKIRFLVENSGLNVADLKNKNDNIVSNAMNAIKDILGQNEQIKTTSFDVRNVYSQKDKVSIFQKYEVTNSFEVKLKDLEKISKVINLAMEHGVKNVLNVSFTVENNENICNQMMGEAVKIAKNRAQYLSSAAGASLDKIKTINPYCSLSGQNVAQKAKLYSNRAMGALEDSVSFDAIQPGAINARASVNMSYYLK